MQFGYFLPNFTFGLAISTFIGQNIGARKEERIVPGERAALKALFVPMIISSVLELALFFQPSVQRLNADNRSFPQAKSRVKTLLTCQVIRSCSGNVLLFRLFFDG